MTKFFLAIARPLEFLLGVVFIAAAVLKAIDANLFIGQIAAYRVISDETLLGAIAIATLWLETFLGVAMLLGLRLKMLVLALVQCMLLGFTGLIVYAWIAHGLEDCGCFGKVKFPPEAAVSKNILMMIAAAVAWRGLTIPGAGKPGAVLWRGGVAVLLASATLAWAVPQMYHKASTPAAPVALPGEGEGEGEAPPMASKPSPFAGMVAEAETGEKYDLTKGRYLIAVLSMDCPHCKQTVPFLNDLYLNPDFPPVVAIVYEPSPGDRENFWAETRPMFPYYSLGDKILEMMALVANAPPRLAYVVEGQIVKTWDPEEPDYLLPTEAEVLEATKTGASTP